MSFTNPTDDFLSAYRAKLDGRQREVQQMADQVRLLQRRLAEEVRLVDRLERYLHGESDLYADLSTKLRHLSDSGLSLPVDTAGAALVPTGGTTEIIPRARPSMTESAKLRSLTGEILRRAGGPMTGPEILQQMEQAGHKFTSKNPIELLKKALKDDFSNVRGRGYWFKDEPTYDPSASV